jgi:hypothetical protein
MSHLREKSPAFVASFLAAALAAGTVCAQSTIDPVATPHKSTSPSTVVVVSNSRDVVLTELDATAVGLFVPKTIARNVAPGKKTSVTIATDKDCVFDLHGIYADGSKTDSTSVDLCRDKAVNLVN